MVGGGCGCAQGCSLARPRAVTMAFGSRMSVAGISAAVAMGAMYSSRFMESIFSVSDSLSWRTDATLITTLSRHLHSTISLSDTPANRLTQGEHSAAQAWKLC